MTENFQKQIEENTSGHGENSFVPDVVANRYNWGAFFFHWIWALVYGKFVIALVALISHVIPFLPLIICIWMGTQGNKWAWQSKKYQSIEEFHQIHRKWAVAGICIGIVIMLMVIWTIVTATNISSPDWM